jgi:hypothetical protein
MSVSELKLPMSVAGVMSQKGRIRATRAIGYLGANALSWWIFWAFFALTVKAE